MRTLETEINDAVWRAEQAIAEVGSIAACGNTAGNSEFVIERVIERLRDRAYNAAIRARFARAGVTIAAASPTVTVHGLSMPMVVRVQKAPKC